MDSTTNPPATLGPVPDCYLTAASIQPSGNHSPEMTKMNQRVYTERENYIGILEERNSSRNTRLVRKVFRYTFSESQYLLTVISSEP